MCNITDDADEKQPDNVMFAGPMIVVNSAALHTKAPVVVDKGLDPEIENEAALLYSSGFKSELEIHVKAKLEGNSELESKSWQQFFLKVESRMRNIETENRVGVEPSMICKGPVKMVAMYWGVSGCLKWKKQPVYKNLTIKKNICDEYLC